MRIEALTDVPLKNSWPRAAGATRTPSASPLDIVADVRRRGDAALFSWSRKLDRAPLTPQTLWIPARERRDALSRLSLIACCAATCRA